MSRKTSFIPLVMTALLILFPSVSLSGAARGVSVWAENAVPTLFPFMAVSAMLINSGALGGLAKICASLASRIGLPRAASQTMAVGMLSGYPVGAGMTAMLYGQDRIQRNEVEITATVSSFCSPVFIISTVGTKLIHNGAAGIIVLVSHYISFAVALPLLRRIFGRSVQPCSELYSTDEKRMSFGNILKVSVENAVKTILTVGGYIVLFSIIIEFIFKCGILPENEYIRCAVSMMLEISNGCAAICSSSLSFEIKTALLCFCTTWGGLCVMLQINGFVSECGVSGKKLMLFKLIQALFSAVCGFLLTLLFIRTN